MLILCVMLNFRPWGCSPRTKNHGKVGMRGTKQLQMTLWVMSNFFSACGLSYSLTGHGTLQEAYAEVINRYMWWKTSRCICVLPSYWWLCCLIICLFCVCVLYISLFCHLFIQGILHISNGNDDIFYRKSSLNHPRFIDKVNSFQCLAMPGTDIENSPILSRALQCLPGCSKNIELEWGRWEGTPDTYHHIEFWGILWFMPVSIMVKITMCNHLLI